VDTVPLADHLTLQFGRALLRILQAIEHSHPQHSPVYMIKINLADGFYCIHIAPANIPLLGVTFPQPAQEAVLIAFPMALPMGWMNLPPLSVQQWKLLPTWPTLPWPQTSHQSHIAWRTRLTSATPQQAMASMKNHWQPQPLNHINLQPPAHWPKADVFVDDHIALAQGDATQCQDFCWHLLNAISQVFCPIAPPPTNTCNKNPSQKRN